MVHERGKNINKHKESQGSSRIAKLNPLIKVLKISLSNIYILYIKIRIPIFFEYGPHLLVVLVTFLLYKKVRETYCKIRNL